MNAGRNRLIEDLFHQSMELPVPERDGFIEEACGSDSSLKNEVRSLLDAIMDDDSFPNTIEKAITDWKHSVRDEAKREAVSREGQSRIESDGRDPPFSRLGDYRIIRRLGKGGMGEVFEAEQISLRKRVAIKVLPRLIGLSEKAVGDFHKEAMVGAQLKHPNIVSIIAFHCVDGVHFIAQELIEGGRNLAGLFENKSGNARHVRNYFKEMAEKIALVARALQHAHDKGVIHRDVKPTNILIDENDRPLVCDFGLARRMEGTSYEQSQEFSGTTPYMSPEQTWGQNVRIDHRTDIFSLGATLYEALTLKRPFSGDTSNEIVKKLRSTEPERMNRIDKRIPVELTAICARAMEKNSARRYQSMRDFAKDLQCYVDGRPLSRQTIGWFRRTMRWTRRYKTPLSAGISVSASLLIAGWLIANWYFSQYVSAIEAFGWDDFPSLYCGLNWAPHIDPSDLTWPIYATLLDVETQEHIKNDELLSPERKLTSLLKSCRERGEKDLADDVSFFLAYIKRRLAKMKSDPEKRRLLLKAADDLEAGEGFFNPFSSSSFFWRKDMDESIRDGIRINKRNPNVLLFKGVAKFSPLYKGGTRSEFETAVSCLEKTVEWNPAHRIAQATLGRTYFFWARSFWEHDLLIKAEEHTKTANRLTLEHPVEMIHTTLGQIELLREHYEKARAQFEIALDIPGVEKSPYHFNTLCGLGQTWLHLGDFEKALFYLKAAYSNYTRDPHVNAALAEYYFMMKDHKRALEFAERAACPELNGETNIAGVHLLLVRIHAALENMDEIDDYLNDMHKVDIHSPIDLCLACLLCAVLTKDDEPENSQFNRCLLSHAKTMLQDANLDASRLSVFKSALGAYAYEMGEYDTTCRELSAVSTRTKAMEFPEETVQFKMKTACDLFFLAMAWHGLRQAPGPMPESPNPKEIFKEGEALYREQMRKAPFIDYWDVYERVYNKAKTVLGM